MINNAVKLAFNDIPQQFEFWGIKKDGTIFPKEVNLTSTIYFGQKAIIAVARDITERKHNEEAIRESEKRFKTMAENMSNALQNILSRNH